MGRAEQVRAQVLGRAQDLDKLRQEVSEMRQDSDNLGTKSTAAERRHRLS